MFSFVISAGCQPSGLDQLLGEQDAAQPSTDDGDVGSDEEVEGQDDPGTDNSSEYDFEPTEIYGNLTTNERFSGAYAENDDCVIEYDVETVPSAPPTGCQSCEWTFKTDLIATYTSCGYVSELSDVDVLDLEVGVDADAGALLLKFDSTWTSWVEGSFELDADEGQASFSGSGGWVEIDAGYELRDVVDLNLY